MIGDRNAKIDDEAVEGISGTHGLGDRNEAGERMIEFCEANQFMVTNTYKQPRCRLRGHHLLDSIEFKLTC